MKTEKENENKKKYLRRGIILLVALSGIAIAVFIVVRSRNIPNEMIKPPLMEGMGEDVISSSGITSVGMEAQTWELDFLDTALYVDESYLVIGEDVSAGTAILHVSEETLSKARKELENALTQAQLEYRKGYLTYGEDKINALTTYETAAVSEKYAQTEYDRAVAEVKKTVEELENQVEEAKELVEEYTKSETEDYYRTYYKVDELYQNYYDHFNLLMDYYSKWNIEETENNSNKSIESNASGATQQSIGGGTETSQKQSVYQLLDELVQEEGDAYEAALESYEDAKELAAASLPQAQSNLSVLEAQLTKARTQYEIDMITCKADYATTLAESQNAQSVYDTTLQSLEETLLTLEDAREEAQENLRLFEETVGDGYYYTEKAGTIVVNAIRAKSYLSEEALVIAYNNPETVTISANVDQSDIANIQIGDSAYVVVSEYGNFEGKVTMMNPVTTAQSRSSVTYQVTVTLEGDISTLDSNLTAYVYFGVTDSMLQQIDSFPQMDGEMRGKDDEKKMEK